METISTSFETILTPTVQKVAMVSLLSSFVVIAALIFHSILRHRLSSRWLYAFWVLVAFRFVLLIAPASPTSFLNCITTPNAESYTVGELDNQPTVAIESISIFKDFTADEPAKTIGRVKANSLSQSTWQYPQPWTIATVIWGIGFTLLLVRLIRQQRGLQRLIRECEPPSSALHEQLELAQLATGCTRNIQLVTTDQIGTPASTRIFRPIIILPTWCERELSSEELYYILIHEVTHISRHDGLIQLLAYLVAMTHWFNPLAWLTINRIENECELSCDAKAIGFLTQNDPNSPQHYGHTILKIASHAPAKNNFTLEPPLVGGFLGPNKNLIKQRIAMLTTNYQPKNGALLFLSCCLALVMIGFTSAQQTPNVTPEVNTPELLPSPKTSLSPSPQQQPTPIGRVTPTPIHRVADSKPADTTRWLKEKIPANEKGRIQLEISSVKQMQSSQDLAEILIENPGLVRITPTSRNEIQLVGLKVGKTDLHLSNGSGKTDAYSVEVTPNMKTLRNQIAQRFPKLSIQSRYNDQMIWLTGSVPEDQVDQVQKFVVSIAPENTHVVNQLSSKLIAIETEVYSVATDKLESLDWAKFTRENPKFEQDGSPVSLRELISDKSQPIGHDVVGPEFSALLSSLTDQKVTQLLDRPVLVTQDNKQAEFLRGGEVPIMVIEENGQQKVEFRPFGTQLKIKPIVQSEEKILLEVQAEVSEIAKDLSMNNVPGFRVRRINIGSVIKPGTTLAIVGDFKENDKREELVFLLKARLIDSLEMK